MNVFLLNDNWADCGCGVTYTEAVFQFPGRAMAYVNDLDTQEYNARRERHIKFTGRSDLKVWNPDGPLGRRTFHYEPYPEFEPANWRRSEDENNLAQWDSGRWTIQEVVVR
jgi:hypothetical protein